MNLSVNADMAILARVIEFLSASEQAGTLPLNIDVPTVVQVLARLIADALEQGAEL